MIGNTAAVARETVILPSSELAAPSAREHRDVANRQDWTGALSIQTTAGRKDRNCLWVLKRFVVLFGRDLVSGYP